MVRWLMTAAVPVLLGGSLTATEPQLARIKKVDGDRVTFRYSLKNAKEVALPIAKDSVVAKAVLKWHMKYDRQLYVAGEKLDRGLEELVFQKIEDERGLSVAIATNAEATMITQILVHPSVYRKN